MSATEQAPEVKPQGKPNPTVRSVATLTGLVVGSAVLVGLFAIGGPLIAAGGLAAAGGATYVRHRMKNPRRSTIRRTTTSKTGGKLTWPLTGNQTRRALLPRGSAGSSGAKGKGSSSSGRKLASLPGLTPHRARPGRKSSGTSPTTRSRAKRSAGGVLPKHKAARSVKPVTAVTRGSASSKPRGTRPPKTATRTAAKPGQSRRLMAPGRGTSSQGSKSKGSRTGLGASRSANRRPSTRGPFSGVLRPSARSKPNGGGRSNGSNKPSTFRPNRSGSPRSGLSPIGLSRKLGGKRSSSTTGRSRNSSSRPFGLTSGASKRPSIRRASSSKNRRGGSGRTAGTKRFPNPIMRTSPSGQHRRVRNPLQPTIGTPGRLRGQTTRKGRKFGNPKAAHRPGPSRTRSRPVPYKRASARKLLRLSVGLPYRNKADKLKRPTAQQRRRARRTLRLRGLTYLAASRHLPKLALNKLWDDVYARVPQPPLKEWQQPTVPDLIQLPTRRPAIALGPSPITPEVPRNMSVTDAVSDAFSMISQFEPEGVKDVELFIMQQPDMFKEIGRHYRTLADRMTSEMPFDPSVADGIRDLAAAIEASGQVAGQVHALMRNVHEEQFRGIEGDIPGQELWNTDRN